MNTRYPIGSFEKVEHYTAEQLQQWIDTIAKLPRELNERLNGIDEAATRRTYREGGWSVRQVVHHLADSHMMAYTRMKLALTEDNPAVVMYAEERWAELPDSALPVHVSLTLLGSLHMRWVELFRAISSEDMKRTFMHPELGAIRIADLAALYAWHSEHHLKHIEHALAQ